jgi:alkanesulfonate monooxygenase SsuD/methylene tetrahydromethanopterin reductase-like flavin-dependent oxidoreductase (luciferase family)
MLHNEVMRSASGRWAGRALHQRQTGTGRGEPKPEPTRPEDLPWERHFVGSQDEVAEGLSQICQEASYGHLCVWGRPPGPSHEQALKSMCLFASEVAPKVRESART